MACRWVAGRRWVHQALKTNRLEHLVTTAFETPRRRRSNATIVVVGLAAVAAGMTFVVTGITFLALAIAFPIALPFAEHFSVYVTPRDIEIATQFASISWIFGVL